jgi:inner membrane protein
MSLLCWAPVGAWLAVTESVLLSMAGLVVVLWLSMLPDYDYHLPLVSHRGSTHTIWFVLLFGAACAGVGFVVGSSAWVAILPGSETVLAVDRATGLAIVGALIGTVTVSAHIIADALTHAGVTPFWPVWRRELSFGVCRSPSRTANYTLLALGLLATAVAALFVVSAGVSW